MSSRLTIRPSFFRGTRIDLLGEGEVNGTILIHELVVNQPDRSFNPKKDVAKYLVTRQQKLFFVIFLQGI